MNVLYKLVDSIYSKAPDSRVLIYTKHHASAIDNALWTIRQNSFIPHGMDGDELLEGLFAVIVSVERNPNGSRLLICVDDLPNFELFPNAFDKLLYIPSSAAYAEVDTQLKASFEVTKYEESADGRWMKSVC